MKIETTKTDKAVVVVLSGRMDAVTAPEFGKCLDEFIEEGVNSFVVNFGGLEYISSAGLRFILAGAKKLKPKNGQIVIVNLNGIVKEVFEISGFITLFKTYDSEEEALKHL